MAQFVTDTCTLDWLTLTMYTAESALEFALNEPGRLMKIRNYEGRTWGDENKSGSLFVGHGQQKMGGIVKPHHMVRGSAECSIDILTKALHLSAVGRRIKCTRIDLQITVPLQSGTVFNGSWLWKHFPKPSTIVGTGELVSLYPQGFGASSDRYWRIYVKEADSGLFLRFEVMLRAQLAQMAYDKLQKGSSENMALIWLSEHDRMVKKWPALLDVWELEESCAIALRQANGGDVPGMKVSKKETDTYNWLMTVAIPSMRRFINDHGTDDIQRMDVLKELEKCKLNNG